jgi:ribonuclease P protein component
MPTLTTIKKKREFDWIYERGRKAWNHAYVIYVSPTPGAPPPGTTRYGITASRRVGDSVRRNRAKRLIREALRLSAERLRSGLDIVVVVRSPANGLKCPEAQRLLLQLLDRCDALVPNGDGTNGRAPRYAKRQPRESDPIPRESPKLRSATRSVDAFCRTGVS